jgi:hypothetical protein
LAAGTELAWRVAGWTTIGRIPMDAVDLLKTEHARLDDLLHEMTIAADGHGKRAVLRDVAEALVGYAKLEGHSMNRLEAALEDAGLCFDPPRSLHVGRIVTMLGGTGLVEATSDARLAALQQEVDCALDSIETGLLVELRSGLTGEQRETLGRELAGLRDPSASTGELAVAA